MVFEQGHSADALVFTGFKEVATCDHIEDMRNDDADLAISITANDDDDAGVLAGECFAEEAGGVFDSKQPARIVEDGAGAGKFDARSRELFDAKNIAEGNSGTTPGDLDQKELFDGMGA